MLRRTPLHRRLFGLVFVTLALVGSSHVSTTAAPPLIFVCETESFGQVNIVVAGFERFGSAVAQCASFWHGVPVLGNGS